MAFYFHAEDRQALIQQYQVKLRQYKQQISFGSEQEIIHDFKTWVEQHPSALLVYDNVENHDMLDSLVPNLKRLRILITSRREFGIGAEVASMTEQEAHDLLLGILRHQTYKDNDIDQISSLIKELHYFGKVCPSPLRCTTGVYNLDSISLAR